MTYAQKLRDPRWQKRRLEILQRDGFKCCVCGDTEKELHVHHKHYQKGFLPWQYEDDMLISLCFSCHLEIEEINKSLCYFTSDGESHEAFYLLIHLIQSGKSNDATTALVELLNRLTDNGNDPCMERLSKGVV